MSITVPKKLKQGLKKAIIIILGLYVMIGMALYLLQEKILFRPTVLQQDYKFEFSYPYEELFLKTDENAVINAIHFKVENPKGVILYFHGNAGDLQRWGMITEFFVEKDYDVFVMDYRTYGKSTGTLSEAALYSDAQFCYDYLKENYNTEMITIYGRSLGTGIATYIASKNVVKQLILETPYYSITDVAKHRFPLYPVTNLLKYKLPSFEFIKKVNSPIFMFHGTDDAVVPFKSGKKLSEIVSKNQLHFTTIEAGNHNNLIEFDAYKQGIDNILK